VVVLGGGFTYWNLKGNKSTVSPTISPTPTKSVAVSSSASASTNKTATPATTNTPTPSSTVTPNFPVPSGWKLTTVQFPEPQPHNLPRVITYFTFYTKDTWVCSAAGDYDYICSEGDNRLFTLGDTGSGINTETFPSAQIIEVTTKDIAGNRYPLLITSSPTKPDILGYLDINSNTDIQIVKKSLEQK